MRILLDQNLPERIGRELVGNEAVHAFRLGWDDLANGDLLDAAESAGFELFLTADRNLRYQQNLSTRRIAIIVLTNNNLAGLLQHIELVRTAVASAAPGSFNEVAIPRPPRGPREE